MSSERPLFESVLASMRDGVITITVDGRIRTFNAAAGAIFGIPPEEAIGKPPTALFLAQGGNEELSDTILAAIYEPNVTHTATVTYRAGGREMILAVKTSRLRAEEGEAPNAVVVVFSDVTEITRLAEAERALTEELKQTNAELRSAYLDIENKNQELSAALKKVQVIRTAATGLVLLLFIGVGAFTTFRSRAAARPSASAPAQRGDAPLQTAVVQPTRLTDRISLVGTLKPRKVVNVTCPFSGNVAQRLVAYGEAVVKGQPLLRMDAGELQVKLRDATAAFIKADEHLKLIEGWESGNEVARARRSLLRAQMAVDAQQQEVTASERLLAKGIIPQAELDGARKQLESARMDLATASEELQSVLAVGGPNGLKLAELELENVRRHKTELERQLAGAVVSSPVSGTVIVAEAGDRAREAKAPENGVPFTEGEVLLSIGDTEGLSAAVAVDEMEVLKVRKGLAAEVSGDAFPDVRLAGTVTAVSTQATGGRDGGGRPGFEIAVTVDELSPAEREKVRLGMTARIEIIVLDRPDALMVPLAAVQLSGDERFIQVKNRTTGQLEAVPVRTGITTSDSVEVVSGLAAGDEIAWSEGDSRS